MIEMWWLKKKIGFTGTSRAKILSLGLLPLAAILDFAVIAAFVYAVSFTGVFLPIVRQGMGTEPAAWVLWIGDPAWTQISVAAIAGLVGGIVFRKWPVVSGLALVLTFPSFLSVKALAVLFLAERLGYRVYDLYGRRGGDARLRGLALLATILGFVSVFLVGQMFQTLWGDIVGFESIFHPRSRFILGGLVMSLGLAFEVGLNLVSFHFYFERVAHTIRGNVQRT